MKNTSHLVIGVVAILSLFTAFAAADAATVSDQQYWFDQDKTHIPRDQEALPRTSWGYNYYNDANGSGYYDPGESWSDDYHADWEYIVDKSCWMASAANLFQYVSGENHYTSWAYSDGLVPTDSHLFWSGMWDPWGGFSTTYVTIPSHFSSTYGGD